MERYLNRELTEDESDWFEAYLLDRPTLAKQMAAEDQLRKSTPLIKAGRSKVLAKLITAAMVPIVLTAGFYFSVNRRSNELIIVPDVVLLDSLRGLTEVNSGVISSEWVLVSAIAPSGAKTATIKVGDVEKIITLNSDAIDVVIRSEDLSKLEIIMVDATGQSLTIPRPP